MSPDSLYRTLVPDAPLHLHTEVDAALTPDNGQRVWALARTSSWSRCPTSWR